MSQAPRIIHGPDADDAIALVSGSSILITMSKVGKMNVFDFTRKLKVVWTFRVMLSQNTRGVATLDTGEGIDRIFVWSDSRYCCQFAS